MSNPFDEFSGSPIDWGNALNITKVMELLGNHARTESQIDSQVENRPERPTHRGR